MDKAVIYTHEVGKVYANSGTPMPGGQTIFPRWSLGIRSANLILASGQPGVDGTGRPVTPEQVSTQIKASLDNGRKIIEGGGGTFADVFKIRAYFKYPEDAASIQRAIGEYCAERVGTDDFPAITSVICPGNSGLMRGEVEMFAATDHRSVVSDELYPGFAPQFDAVGWTHAVKVGNLAFTSGMLPFDREGLLVGDDAASQTAAALGNAETALADAGHPFSDVVKLTTWIDSADDVDAVLAARREFLRENFGDGAPAATTLVAPLAVDGARVQIEAIAASGEREVIIAPGVPTELPNGEPNVHAVKVALESETGSYLRRFSWPSYPADADRESLGSHLEVLHPLGHIVFISAQGSLAADGSVAGTKIEDQAAPLLGNLRSIAEAAGGGWSSIAQVDLYFREFGLYKGFSEARTRFMEENTPDKDWFAGSGPIAASTIPGAFVEIEAIALVP